MKAVKICPLLEKLKKTIEKAMPSLIMSIPQSSIHPSQTKQAGLESNMPDGDYYVIAGGVDV